LSATSSGSLPVDGEITLYAVLDGNTLAAYVDPVITLPIGYTIAFSAGIGNSALSSVPEPSTWMMMLAGLAGLGFAGWRKAKDQSSCSFRCLKPKQPMNGCRGRRKAAFLFAGADTGGNSPARAVVFRLHVHEPLRVDIEKAAEA
jgi:hypothetical protein